MRKSDTTPFEDEVKRRPGIFVNGAHHPRELTSITMVVYMMLKFLYESVHGNSLSVETNLLDKAAIFFTPVVNIDGVYFLEKHYRLTGKLIWIRKNKRELDDCPNGVDYEEGVDLNRNYGYGWGGGETILDPCEKTYGGPFPFSEPETQSIKNFMETWRSIKLALNIHAFGNLICIPFMADD
jgi:carboxypeptidase T